MGREDKIVGDIRQGLFYTDYMLQFINSKIKEKCFRCKLFPLCLGSCAEISETMKGKEICQFSLIYIKSLLKQYIV